jgi:hypothetical protein
LSRGERILRGRERRKEMNKLNRRRNREIRKREDKILRQVELREMNPQKRAEMRTYWKDLDFVRNGGFLRQLKNKNRGQDDPKTT